MCFTYWSAGTPAILSVTSLGLTEINCSATRWEAPFSRTDDCLDVELRFTALHPRREFFDPCGDDFLRAALLLIPLGNCIANLIARFPLVVLNLGKHDHRSDRLTLHPRERQPCGAFTRSIDMKEQVSIGRGGMQVHGISKDRLLEGFEGKRYVGHDVSINANQRGPSQTGERNPLHAKTAGSGTTGTS
jgi:hypothetical protein